MVRGAFVASPPFHEGGHLISNGVEIGFQSFDFCGQGTNDVVEFEQAMLQKCDPDLPVGCRVLVHLASSKDASPRRVPETG